MRERAAAAPPWDDPVSTARGGGDAGAGGRYADGTAGGAGGNVGRNAGANSEGGGPRAARARTLMSKNQARHQTRPGRGTDGPYSLRPNWA